MRDRNGKRRKLLFYLFIGKQLYDMMMETITGTSIRGRAAGGILFYIPLGWHRIEMAADILKASLKLDYRMLRSV